MIKLIRISERNKINYNRMQYAEIKVNRMEDSLI